jgi:FMN phosphatase YigB (HAD superfamily)
MTATALAREVQVPRATARTEARAWELEDLLDEHPDVRVLSLDCFDTLLWRSTAAPEDVFYDLAHHPAFARLGMNARIRVVAEGTARERALVSSGSSEVTLAQIYRAAFPDLDDAAVSELSAAEVEAEIRACVALPATVALIRKAKARGLRVVIVSDTYLREPELRRLLAAALPGDAYEAVDGVWCSCDHGRSKAGGLFKPVLDALGVRARDVLHVGDNPTADVEAARAIGANAVRLVHHDDEVAAMLRMQSTATSLLHPIVRDMCGMPSPFRMLLASSPLARTPDPVFTLGYASLGPVLYAFARWLSGELREMRAASADPSRVKPVFLLRDGWLPARIVRALDAGAAGPLVSISRFAAIAASFRTAADVERYLAGWVGSERLGDLARQLLLTEDEGRAILLKARRAARPADGFVREVLRPKTLALVLERSARYRARMIRHLESAAGIREGDTVVFVDLGYEGTAQRQLEPVLRDELGVEVVGRYLVAARVPGWERSRRGLLDPSWCDDRLVATIVAYVALLENLCAAAQGSTIDYADDGTPVLAAARVRQEQVERVRPVQDACERFALDAAAFFAETGATVDLQQLRIGALGALARMLFLPSRAEAQYVAGFALDMNLGVEDELPLLDVDAGLDGLRKRGLFFLGADCARASRIAGPAELRAASLEMALTLAAQHRFGLDMSPADMTHRQEPLTVIAMRGGAAISAVAEARATHDGFFALHVPMGPDDSAVGVVFGARYAWVQIESVTRVELSALFTSKEADASEDLMGAVRHDGLAHRGGGLYECTTSAAFLLVAATPRPRSRPAVCRIVFRPVVHRRSDALLSEDVRR